MDLLGLFLLLVVVGFLVWRGLTVHANDGQRSTLSVREWPPANQNADAYKPAHPNERFLRTVRSRSCYRMLRAVHEYLTVAAVFVTVILWIALMNNDPSADARIYATFTCGMIIVALLIEYGLFRLIVDAVDVLIVMGQHTAASKQGGTAVDAGG